MPEWFISGGEHRQLSRRERRNDERRMRVRMYSFTNRQLLFWCLSTAILILV